MLTTGARRTVAPVTHTSDVPVQNPHQNVSFASGDATAHGYLALPVSGSGPGLVVIQEWWGLTEHIKDVTDRFAAEGFVALAPDLFWRIEPGIELTDKSEAERQKAFELYGKFDVESGIADIEASIRAVRACAQCTGKVGVVGYCLGGLIAYLSATRTDSNATVGYYGVGIQDKLSEGHAIANPLMLHIATRDQFVPPEAQAAIRAELAANPHVTLYDYEAGHAFARVDGSDRVEASAQQADARTLDFFRKHLA